ncbi:MAG: hypothetical protein JXR64_01880 [Spirochaetales bacterium]|nr:hypothetical protein [Spirochaetales bacterium]
MLKSKGIVYFPPVNNFYEAFSIYKECGGMIISLEEDGFLVDEPIKIAKLYDIPVDQLELYFRDVLVYNLTDDEEIEKIIYEWKIEEKISELKL